MPIAHNVVCGSGHHASARRLRAPSLHKSSVLAAYSPPAKSGGGTSCKFTMPVLQCSQPLRMNSNMWRVWEQADAWLLSTMKPSTREEEQELLQWRVPLLGCTTCVDMDEEMCLLNTQFILSFVLLDDVADDIHSGLGLDQTAARSLYQSLLRCLLDGTELPRLPAHLPERHHRAVDLFGWRQQLRRLMSRPQEARFLDGLRRSLADTEAQVLQRASGQFLDLETYIARRRYTSGMYTFFVLLEIFLGMDAEDPILDCDLLQELRTAANDYISSINDLFSLRNEYLQGDYSNNLVTVLWKSDPSCNGDLAQSVEKARQMIQQKDEDFSRLVHEARSSKPIMKARGMDKYLKSLADWMSGNLYWSYATSRYLGKPYPANIPFEVELPILQLQLA